MPKFIEEIIENHFWMETSFEIPDFPDNSDEEFIFPEAFVPEDIATM